MHGKFSFLLICFWFFSWLLRRTGFPFFGRGTPRFIITFLVMLIGNVMKRQTGVRVEAELWAAYRELCGRQRLRLSQPIEDFLRLVVDEGSAVGLLRLMREAVRARVEGHEAYARVLLDWYMHDKYWVKGSGEEYLSVEALLLDALKTIEDPELRGRIEEALMEGQRRIYREKEARKAEKEKGSSHG